LCITEAEVYRGRETRRETNVYRLCLDALRGRASGKRFPAY